MSSTSIRSKSPHRQGLPYTVQTADSFPKSLAHAIVHNFPFYLRECLLVSTMNSILVCAK